MKKILLGLVATVMLSVTANAQTSEIKLSEYGFYHNEGVALFQKNYDKVPSDSKEALQNFTDLLIKKYPSRFEKVDVNLLYTKFYGMNSLNFDIKKLWANNKVEFISKQKVSIQFTTLINEIVEKELGFEQISLKLTDFKSQNKLSTNDLNALEVFESVLKSSNEYWTSTSLSTGKAKPGSKAIAADCLGALMFCYSGPGSIIMGGVCSLFVNEAIE